MFFFYLYEYILYCYLFIGWWHEFVYYNIELQRPFARVEGLQAVAIYVYPAHEPFQLIYYIRKHTHYIIMVVCVCNKLDGKVE